MAINFHGISYSNATDAADALVADYFEIDPSHCETMDDCEHAVDIVDDWDVPEALTMADIEDAVARYRARI